MCKCLCTLTLSASSQIIRWCNSEQNKKTTTFNSAYFHSSENVFTSSGVWLHLLHSRSSDWSEVVEDKIICGSCFLIPDRIFKAFIYLFFLSRFVLFFLLYC